MFFSKKKSILGIDIGTANIKIAQISHDTQPILETYGIVNTPYQLSGKGDENSAIGHMSQLLKALLVKAGVTAKQCVVSLPNSAVFISVIEMPAMNERELASAVEFEAKKYVPLALSEIDLAWTVIDSTTKETGIKILLTAVPKLVTLNYTNMIEQAGLSTLAGEIEALALIRSLIGNQPTNCVIIDMGAKTTGINIVEHGLLRLSRNLNVGGDTITNKLSQALNISMVRAEQFKKDFGVSSATFIPETVKPVLNIVKNEVKQLMTIYQTRNVNLEKIIFVGGASNLPGLIEYFSDLQIPAEMGDPLKAVAYSEAIAPILKRYTPSLSVAIGLGLRKD